MSRAFSSFSTFPDLDAPEQEGSKERKERKEPKTRKEKHKSHKESGHRRRHRSRSRSRSRERSHGTKHRSRRDGRDRTSPQLDERDERIKSREDRDLGLVGNGNDPAYSKEYFIDKRGDALNITYGGIYKSDVPKFYRAGNGKVLGLSPAWNILKDSSKEMVITLRHRPKPLGRYTDAKLSKKLLEGPRQHIAVPPQSSGPLGEFTPLSTRKKGQADPIETYRSILEDKENDSDGSHSQASLSSSEDEGVTLTADQEAIKELEAILDHRPDDEQAWLRLWEISTRSLPRTMGRSTQVRTEISLSILRKAMDAHKNNRESLRLRLLYIEYGSPTWSDERTRREWDDLLDELGGAQVPIWKRTIVWMAWLERQFVSRPTVGEALEAAKQLMAALSEKEFEMLWVRMCWRIAIFMRESGFLEQAMALFQAQIELSHFCPPSLAGLSLASRLDHLEEFWDAEVPRVGEDGAKGWCTWHTERKAVEEHFMHQPSGVPSIDDPYQQWCFLEKALDQVGVFPSRSFNEDEIDPYSTILFSDVRPFLSDVRTDAAKEYLRLAFISFLGMNIPGISETRVLAEFSDSYLNFENGWMHSGRGGWVANPSILFPPSSEDRLVTWESHSGVTIALETPKRSGFGPVKEWTTARSYLEGSGIACEGRAWEAADVTGVDASVVRRVFHQLAPSAISDRWQEMSVSLDAATDIKLAIKESKQRLEQERGSVKLWRIHASLERYRGKRSETSKVYDMAVSIDPQSSSLPLLTADAVEYYWFSGEEPKGRQLLAQFLGVNPSLGGINLLRAKKELDSRVSMYEVFSSQWEACFRLRFFLELGSGTLQDALRIADLELSSVPAASSVHESLTTWLCLTLFNLAQSKGMIIPPAILAEHTSFAMKQYPNNTIILGLFLESERGQGIWGRVRGLLDETENPTLILSQSISRIAWEVWAEGWSHGPWQSERVRAKLEKATGTSLRYSVLLWRIYLSFEMRVGDMERAKALLFRALGHCPHAKELYMMAAGPLRPELKPKELNDLFAAMAERGVRTRRDVREFLEGWVDPDILVDEDQAMGDAELERFLHEREQAKPY